MGWGVLELAKRAGIYAFRDGRLSGRSDYLVVVRSAVLEVIPPQLRSTEHCSLRKGRQDLRERNKVAERVRKQTRLRGAAASC